MVLLYRKWKFPLIIGFLLIAISLSVVGCRSNNDSKKSGTATIASQGIEKNSDSKNMSNTDGVEINTKAEETVAGEAVNHAQESNPGSEFEVTSIMIAGKWARVNIQEVEVPVEEAIAFVVVLRKDSDGEWTIAKTGTDIAPEDFPEAPSELFK